jgi:adenine/guanine phosphoribosyltransferase-like PRPP-binding protein
MKEIICNREYELALNLLLEKIPKGRFNCIVCLKRSGFIIGAFLSNKLNLPLFTASEINSIPDNFINVLIVDDKICTGKSIKKVLNKLTHKVSETACLFIEGTTYTNFFTYDIGKIVKMWYEV